MQRKSLRVQPAMTNDIRKGKQTDKCSYSRNTLTRLQLDLGKSGYVVLDNIHFCTKEKTVGHGNASSRFEINVSRARCSGINLSQTRNQNKS